MSHYSLFVGAVTLAVVAMAAPFLPIPWKRLFSRRKPASAPTTPVDQAPKVVREIYLDSDGFGLVGEAWKWVGNQGASYKCPRCDQWVDTTLRDYYHGPSGDTFSLMRHTCCEGQETRPLATVRKEVQ